MIILGENNESQTEFGLKLQRIRHQLRLTQRQVGVILFGVDSPAKCRTVGYIEAGKRPLKEKEADRLKAHPGFAELWLNPDFARLVIKNGDSSNLMLILRAGGNLKVEIHWSAKEKVACPSIEIVEFAVDKPPRAATFTVEEGQQSSIETIALAIYRFLRT